MAQQRHSKQSWINAGLTVLETDGPTALRAEPLAKRLNTTKGSFYWHFADVPAFHVAVIESWQTQTLSALVNQLATDGSPEHRLNTFGQQFLADPLDTPMRLWSQSHPRAKQALDQIDEQRLTYIATLLANLGVSNPAFALACYGTLIGSQNVHANNTATEAFTALIDLVLALK
jgi:AcrR family transcriptional regulator